MKAGIKKAKNVLGFTLVELMIVIGVISVLVTIVSFSYRGAQHSSAVATVKSDLTQAGTKIKTEKLNGVSGTYPTTVPSSVKISDNVVLQVTVAADNSGFCVDGSHQRYDDIRYYYSSDQGLGEGQCSGLTAYVPPEEAQPGTVPQTAPIVSASGVTTTTASFNWTAVEGALGYSGQWRVNGGAWTLADFESAMSTPIGTQPAGAKIEFQARGYNDSGEGPWSSIKTVYLTMGTAPSLSMSDITSTGATADWGSVSGATGYTIQYRVNGGSWTTQSMGTALTRVFGPTTQGNKIEVQVNATNGGSTSPWSSISTAQLTVDPPSWNKWNQTESYPSWTSWITRVDGAAICPAGLNLYSDYRDGIYGSYWNAWRGFTNRGTNATSTAQYVSTISNYTDTLQSQLAGYCKNEASGAVSATINSAVYTAKHVEPTIYLANPVECAGAYSGRPAHYQLRLWLDEVSYNFAANTSNVNWQLYRISVSTTYNSWDQTKTWPWAVSINGSNWSGSSNSIAFKTGGYGTTELIAASSLTVQHDANGNATIGYAGSDGPGSSIFGSASCSGAYGLGDLRP